MRTNRFYMVFEKRVYLTRPPCARKFVRFAQLTRPPWAIVFTRPPPDCFTIDYPGRALCPALPMPCYARFSRRPVPPGHNNSRGLATNIEE